MIMMSKITNNPFRLIAPDCFKLPIIFQFLGFSLFFSRSGLWFTENEFRYVVRKSTILADLVKAVALVGRSSRRNVDAMADSLISRAEMKVGGLGLVLVRSELALESRVSSWAEPYVFLIAVHKVPSIFLIHFSTSI